MAYKVRYTKNFNKDVERCRKRGYDLSVLSLFILVSFYTPTAQQIILTL